MDYPIHVQFETFAQCNAACSFCVYPDMERKGAMMPMSLIDKIIGDLQEIPSNIEFQISPFAVNEPFLDKRLFTILDKISEKLPGAKIALTSNASPITDEILRKLSAYKLGYLWLSVVDYRKDVYEEKMKLPFGRMLARLSLVHEAKASGALPFPIVISRLKDGSEHDELFSEFMSARFPHFDVVQWPYANWIGATENQVMETVPDIPCSHWFEFRIDANGIVQHCCMDGHSQYPWGDVKKDSVLAIYNQPRYRRLRAQVSSRREVSPCNVCNLR